jgi:hypothetical protein
MKRAAVQWGIGRYLYNLEATFVSLFSDKIQDGNRHYDKESKKTYYWEDPALPKWALPEGAETASKTTQDKVKTDSQFLDMAQTAKLMSLAKMKGAKGRDEAISFINGALLTQDFTKLDPSKFDEYKAVISDPKVTIEPF